METMNITLLNPKAKPLLKQLEDLRIIKISKATTKQKSLVDTMNAIREKLAGKITLEEMNEEIAAVRQQRHNEKKKKNSR